METQGLSFNGGHIALPRGLVDKRGQRRLAPFAESDAASECHTEDVGGTTPRTASSVFTRAHGCPDDPILGVRDAFLADPAVNKLNLAVGVYRTEDGQPFVLETVQEAEVALLAEQRAGRSNKEYLAPSGMSAFCDASLRLLFADTLAPALAEHRVVAAQSLSGLGGLHLAGKMIGELMAPGTTIYVPETTWPLHPDIFGELGFRVATYPYYDATTCGLDFHAMINALNAIPRGSVVLLHACAHNPSGVDPTQQQWDAIAAAVGAQGLVPLLDSAYQGFASGDLHTDGYGARALAAVPGVEMFVCQSYAKNMGLYGERAGCFTMVCSDADVAERARQQLCRCIRLIYSSPPRHGAAIVTKVLTESARRDAWQAEVAGMASRLRAMRVALDAALTRIQCPPPHGTTLSGWQHVLSQRGMFTYTGLTAQQVDWLRTEHHIYMPADGRICMACLNDASCDTLALAIKQSFSLFEPQGAVEDATDAKASPSSSVGTPACTAATTDEQPATKRPRK